METVFCDGREERRLPRNRGRVITCAGKCWFATVAWSNKTVSDSFGMVYTLYVVVLYVADWRTERILLTCADGVCQFSRSAESRRWTRVIIPNFHNLVDLGLWAWVVLITKPGPVHMPSQISLGFRQLPQSNMCSFLKPNFDYYNKLKTSKDMISSS